MKAFLPRVFIAFGFLLVTKGNLLAIAPGYISDDELARYPVIVVAKWNRAPFKANHRIEGNVIKKSESFTELEVVRVIAGDVKPGIHKLMVGGAITWSKDGKFIIARYREGVFGAFGESITPPPKSKALSFQKPNVWAGDGARLPKHFRRSAMERIPELECNATANRRTSQEDQGSGAAVDRS